MPRPLTISVPTDELETLLFATGAIKAVESVLKQRDADPLYRQSKGKLTAAHDEIAKVYRRALRDYVPPRAGEPLTEQERDILNLFRSPGEVIQVMDAVAWRSLRERGFVEMGTQQAHIDWPDQGVSQKVGGSQMMARLTISGQEAWGNVQTGSDFTMVCHATGERLTVPAGMLDGPKPGI